MRTGAILRIHDNNNKVNNTRTRKRSEMLNVNAFVKNVLDLTTANYKPLNFSLTDHRNEAHRISMYCTKRLKRVLDRLDENYFIRKWSVDEHGTVSSHQFTILCVGHPDRTLRSEHNILIT